jgi:hypothetical protein
MPGSSHPRGWDENDLAGVGRLVTGGQERGDHGWQGYSVFCSAA